MPASSHRLPRRALAPLALAAAVARPAHATRPAPLFGSYGGAGCTGVPEVQKFEAWLGRKLDLVLDFLETTSWRKMVEEANWMAGCWRGAGRTHLVVSVPMLVREGKPSLAEGARGAYDAHFRSLADTLIASGYADAILRIGWEFNGNWYAWSAQADPAAFAAFWRRIALAMRAAPGGKFRFDWCATTADGPAEAAWPGDDVVDLIGLDLYNQSWPVIPVAALRWQYLLHHNNGLIWHRDFAARHGKPRSFPEWGTGTRPDGHGGGDDPEFVAAMLDWIGQDGGGTPVAYHCYWNYHADDYDAMLSDGRRPRAAAVLRQRLGRA